MLASLRNLWLISDDIGSNVKAGNWEKLSITEVRPPNQPPPKLTLKTLGYLETQDQGNNNNKSLTKKIVRDAYGSIAHAEANLKKTESPVTNPGLTAEKSQKYATKATDAVIDKKDAEAAAASEVEGAKEALMQIRNRGDDVPKGF